MYSVQIVQATGSSFPAGKFEFSVSVNKNFHFLGEELVCIWLGVVTLSESMALIG